ncbi:hypothetical protein BDV34DRAFT_184148 [Aspergillus parasiticus]|uniref:Uncharacterized protein n=1 Tax=Aspergillus parasiticus TaxID=5067 RepID=A0A5N6E4M7_ASPPA|nr:hypothetical protein BDV34DRAFT_184148 [Aspergillus parasiticus]
MGWVIVTWLTATHPGEHDACGWVVTQELGGESEHSWDRELQNELSIDVSGMVIMRRYEARRVDHFSLCLSLEFPVSVRLGSQGSSIDMYVYVCVEHTIDRRE